MGKGTALFDAVAISNTKAKVRAGRRCKSGRCTLGEGVCGRGVRPCGAPGCIGCGQMGGGVVGMLDGAITLKGGTISNSSAVRVRLLRLRIPRRMSQILTLNAA